jgi:maltose/moltooligosaccharide transporter
MPPLDPPVAPAPKKIWSVGTLTYTSGGLAILFFWLLWGDFAWNMKERAIGPVGVIMLKEFGINSAWLGIITASVPSALGLIIAPIIAVRSDRHRSRWGRRIPFLLVPTPLVALSMIGIGCTVPIADWVRELWGPGAPDVMLTRILVFTFFWTTFEIFQTIAQSVLGALCNDVVPQAWIGRFFGYFRAVSLLAAIVFNLFMIEHAKTQFQPIMIGLGLIFGVGFAMMCFFVKEGEYPPPPPPSPERSARDRFITPIIIYFKECAGTPFYLWVFAAVMLAGMAGVPINTYSIPYSRSLGITDKHYGELLVITYCFSLVLTFAMGWFADKFHPLRVGLVAISLYAIVMLFGTFYATDARSFSIAFVAHGVLMGTYITGTASLGARLFPRAKFAQFGSAAGLVGALCFMVLAPGIGFVLDATGSQYRYTFIGSGIIALFGVAAYIGLYRRFLKHGGLKNYVAP